MKISRPELLVGLDDKLGRVLAHWALADRALPPARPLVLLEEMDRAASEGLAESLPGLRRAVGEAELELKLARADYERRKEEVHEWLGGVNRWMRARLQGLSLMGLRRRVPGRGQSYGHWSDAAAEALSMWKRFEANPPVPPPGYSWGTPLGRPLAEFEVALEALEAAWRAWLRAKQELKIARGALRLAQECAAALLMAYGHGVRARLGQRGAIVRSIPQVWPKHKPKRKAA